MKRLLALLVIVAVAAPFSCYHARLKTYETNFATVRLVNHQISTRAGAPYSGTLVARDAEITAVARMVFGDTPMKRAADADPTGLVLVLPVANGVPSGRAELFVDLRAPKPNRELARYVDSRLLAVARSLAPTVRVAEATFLDGKLEGTATVYMPSAGAETKLAQAQLRANVFHGLAIEYFPGTHQPQRELRFDAGVRTGPQRQFYATGQLERESTFVDGVPDGEVKEYFASGAKRARSSYERGKPVGTHQAWFPTGQLQRESVFDAAGDLTSETTWHSNGKLASQVGPDGEQRFAPEGIVEEFHASGTLRARTQYASGVKHGPFEIFYANQQKREAGQFELGKQVGLHRKWWKNGQLAHESSYVNGALHGTFKRWYARGTLWESARYEAGKLEGTYRKWWKNGAPAHVYAYKHGKLDGDYRLFYDTGAKWAIGSYANGKPLGTLQRWFPDGKLGYIMHHTNGRPDGPFRRWYADGKPRLKATYVAGQLDGELENWREDGSVYELATYQRGLKTRTTRPEPSATAEP